MYGEQRGLGIPTISYLTALQMRHYKGYVLYCAEQVRLVACPAPKVNEKYARVQLRLSLLRQLLVCPFFVPLDDAGVCHNPVGRSETNFRERIEHLL